jgi:hypothetical protein
MYRIILLAAFSLIIISVSAQIQTQIIGDTVRIHSNAGKGELILNNSTDSVNGFLFNKSAGRTVFQRGLIKITDSTYLIGADTLHLNNMGGLENIGNVFYVSKKYTGPGGAVVTGFTLSSITSANAGYTSQLSKAVPGSMVFSYPDPFAARNAAMDAMAAGKISSAEIVVLEGNKYTVGSNDSSKNGNMTGSAPNSSVTADIGFSQASLVPDSSISSIMKNKINMYFSEGSGFTYINSTYNIYCYYNRDTANFVSGVYGLGNFYQVYGEVNGFVATFGLIGNYNSTTSFHAQNVVLQEYNGFSMWEFRTANITIENLASSETVVFSIGEPGYATDTAGSINSSPNMITISVKNARFGKGQSGYPDSEDLWYFFVLSNTPRIEGTLIKVDIGNLFMRTSNVADLFYIHSGSLLYNTNVTMNIDNLVHRDSHIYSEFDGALIYAYGPGLAINNSITYNIRSADIDAPLLGFFNFTDNIASKNNRFNLICGDVKKNNSAFTGGLLNVTSITGANGGQPLYFKVKGNFKSFDNFPVINAYDDWYSYPSPNRYEFSGSYQTFTPGISVIHFYANTGKIVALTDAMLINDGVTNSIFADASCNGQLCNCCSTSGPITIPVYIKNVHANAGMSTNITQVGGTITVEPDIQSFFK